jgi:hypothetical protein
MRSKNIFRMIWSVCVSFTIYGMEWIGLDSHWPDQHSCGSGIYYYCLHHKRDRNCGVINAYLLLMRQPEKNVTQQIEFYEKQISFTQQKIDGANNFIDKRCLQLEEEKLQKIVSQIKRPGFSGKPGDRDTQEKLGVAFDNILSRGYDWEKKFELSHLYKAQWNAKRFF